MRGMIVSAVKIAIILAMLVVLVAAAIIIALTGSGMAPVKSLNEARNSCALQGQESCIKTGNVPLSWDVKTMTVDGEKASCEEVCGAQDSVCTKSPGSSPRWLGCSK